MVAVRVCQHGFKFIQCPVTAIDRPRSPRGLHLLKVVGAGQQRIQIHPGDTLIRHQKLMRTHIGVDRRLITAKRGKQRNIQLINPILTGRGAAHGCKTAPRVNDINQLRDLRFIQQSFQWPHPDTVVRSNEVEVAATLRSRHQRLRPIYQSFAIASQIGIEQQRCQAELVHPMRLVGLTKVTDVLFMGHVGFGDQGEWYARDIGYPAQNSHHHMRLWQAHTRGANAFPQIGNRIQTNIPGTHTNVEQKYANELQKNIGIGKIQIHLIFAEGSPYLFYPSPGVHFGQQRRVARSQHQTQICLAHYLMEVVPTRRCAGEKIGKPQMLARAVVDNQVDHQLKVTGQVLYVRPITKIRTHSSIINHRKAIVRGRGEERQHMNSTNNTGEIRIREVSKYLQRRSIAIAQAVCIADQHRLGSRLDNMLYGVWFSRSHRRCGLLRHGKQILMQALSLLGPVELDQVRQNLVINRVFIDSALRQKIVYSMPIQWPTSMHLSASQGLHGANTQATTPNTGITYLSNARSYSVAGAGEFPKPSRRHCASVWRWVFGWQNDRSNCCYGASFVFFWCALCNR